MASNQSFGLDVGIYGESATPETILGLAHLAEELEFDSIWLADHVAFPVAFSSKYPYSATGAFPTSVAEPLMEPLAVMGVLAGATKRLRIGAAVLVIPYRNPVLLARMMVTLDQFSNGRMILGAGVGWLAEEFAVLNTVPFEKRGKATDEALEIFKAICAGGEVGYEGETYRFDPIHARPGSVQRPHPPILIGGVSNPALRRTVRHGTGWLAVSISPERAAERLAVLRDLCARQGRRFEELSLVFKIFLSLDEEKRSPSGGREPGTGSAALIVDDLKRIVDMGFDKIIVRHRGSGAAEQRAQIERFVEEIIPKV